MTDTERIAEIRARAEAATPGPWKTEDSKRGICIYDRHTWAKGLSPFAVVEPGEWRNADFAVSAREDIPYLLERLDTLQKEVIQLAQESVRRDVTLAKLEAEVEAAMEAHRWIPVSERLPELDEEMVLAIVNGKPKSNITLVNAYEFAEYSTAEGWILEAYPEWESPTVTHWMQTPEAPEEGEEVC